MGKKYRYPGVNFFTKDDREIFKGREDDANRLLTQLMLSNTLVFHAESGVGKSSLINAGLLPLIDEKINKSREDDMTGYFSYLPIILRLDTIRKLPDGDSKDLIVKEIVEAIRLEFKDLDKNDLPYTDGISEENLWIVAKKLFRKNIKLLLVLDQFEELQTFSIREIEELKIQLSSLLSSSIPKTIYPLIKSNTSKLFADENINENIKEEFNVNMRFLETPVDAKVLFVIREDKLGTMSLLSDYFPDILKNDFIIKPLSKEGAIEAIVKPAGAPGDFESPAFSYERSPNLVETFVDSIADNETKLIDPIQLQIVCSEIEKNLVIAKKKKVVKLNVNEIGTIEDIIRSYYSNAWTEVKNNSSLNLNENDFEKVRKTVTSELIVNDRRNLFQIGALTEKDNVHNYELVISILVKKGIMRPVPQGKDKYFQLCHDRFIEPVKDDIDKYKMNELVEESKRLKNLYKEQERLYQSRKKTARLVIALVILILMILVFFLVNFFRQNASNQGLVKEKEVMIEEKDSILLKLQQNDSFLTKERDEKSEAWKSVKNAYDSLNEVNKTLDSTYQALHDARKRIEIDYEALTKTSNALEGEIKNKNTILRAFLNDKGFRDYYRLQLQYQVASLTPEKYPNIFKLSGDSLFTYGEFEKAKSVYSIAFQLGYNESEFNSLEFIVRMLELDNLVIVTDSINFYYDRGYYENAKVMIRKLLVKCPKFQSMSRLLSDMEDTETCILSNIQDSKPGREYDHSILSTDYQESKFIKKDYDYNLDFNCDMPVFPYGYAESMKEFSTIDLSGLGLKYLPEDFKELNHLKSFNLSNNNFTYLPLCVEKMDSLEGLNLSMNPRLTQFEKSEVVSNSLKRLNLAECDNSFIRNILERYHSIEGLTLYEPDSSLINSLRKLQNLKCVSFVHDWISDPESTLTDRYLFPTNYKIPQNIAENKNIEVVMLDLTYKYNDFSSYFSYFFLSSYLNCILPVNFCEQSNIKYLIIKDLPEKYYSNRIFINRYYEEINKLIPVNCKVYYYFSDSRTYRIFSQKKHDPVVTNVKEINYLNSLMPR